jgi:hypothetical protein
MDEDRTTVWLTASECMVIPTMKDGKIPGEDTAISSAGYRIQ